MQEPRGDETLLPLPATLDQAAIVSGVPRYMGALVDNFAEEVDRSILRLPRLARRQRWMNLRADHVQRAWLYFQHQQQV